MKKYIAHICIAVFCLVVGGVGVAFYLDKTTVSSATPNAIPKVMVTGADGSYLVGDIVTLSINEMTYPSNTLQAHYDWHVFDPNREEKNFITSKDGTSISFGTGSKPTKIRVVVNASAVLGTKDSSGNIKDISLQSSGMSCFEINIVSSKNSMTNEEKKVVAARFRGRADAIKESNMNATEAHRAITTIAVPDNVIWSRWEKENKRLMLDSYKSGKLKQGDDYSKLCLDIADKLEAGK